ncbi:MULTISPECIES: MazG-like family protein [Sanguibacteroides]|uniref:NTP pyrophosphohydrolase MazG putative catalytic core domain-containing protein n=1 Tax=Sanguibacteroides justesenii TaxID=1547597 RepID=A0A0C3RH95_9PORP|nr:MULTISPECIES: MazG-like family protein [Sanguibacteroides]KIO46546.1 hypothetical protein BA92_01340 [Sanguibacteroides justesenii]
METSEKSIDDWAKTINQIYERNNCERSFKDIIVFFYEDVGRCFQLINRKREAEIEKILPSIFKWFCVLFFKYSNRNINLSDVLWNKFPGICPYCQKTTCQCRIGKEQLDIPSLRDHVRNNIDRKPKTINEWQSHFQKIYPRGAESSFIINVSHLAEELAELSEAYRKKHIKKDLPCVEMEMADVFSWIMGLANLIHQLKDAQNKRLEYRFGSIISEKYKDGCPDCKDLRKVYKISYCCCPIKEHKLQLISDYEIPDEEEVREDIKPAY